MSFMAIDIGSGLTKCSGIEGDNFYFESLVGQHKEVSDFSFNVEPHFVLNVGDKRFLTGPAAKSYIEPDKRAVTAKATWCEDPNQVYLLYSAIAKAHPNGYKGEMIIVAGLPMSKFSKYHTIHKNLFIGTHKFSTPKHDYVVEILPENIEVFPQAVGLHFSLLENRSDGKWNEGEIGYVDPGTHTCGYAVVSKGVYNNLKSANDKSAGAEAGMMKLAKLMKKELQEQFDWDPETDELLDALRVGYVDIMGDKVTRIILKDIAARYVPKVYGPVVEELVEKWAKARTMSVLVSSGGSSYIIDYIKRFIPHAELLHKTRKANEKVNEKALYDVVNGYRIYGKIKFKNKLADIKNNVVTAMRNPSAESQQKLG